MAPCGGGSELGGGDEGCVSGGGGEDRGGEGADGGASGGEGVSAEMLPGVGGILGGDGGGRTKGGGGDCMAAACSFGTILIATMLRDAVAVMTGFNARELRCQVRAEAELCRRIEGGIVARDRERTLPRVAAQAGRIVKEGAADRQKHWSPLIRAQSCVRHEGHPRKASEPHLD